MSYFDWPRRVEAPIWRMDLPVWSNEYHLHADWAPVMPLLDEIRAHPIWWAP